jgi:hypothetical protein
VADLRKLARDLWRERARKMGSAAGQPRGDHRSSPPVTGFPR